MDAFLFLGGCLGGANPVYLMLLMSSMFYTSVGAVKMRQLFCPSFDSVHACEEVRTNLPSVAKTI